MLHVMTLDLIKGHALSSSHKEFLHIWDLKVMWIYLFYNLDDVMERHKCLEKLKNPIKPISGACKSEILFNVITML